MTLYTINYYLEAWNLRDDLDSNGAILFRRFAGRALSGVSVVPDQSVFLVPFNPLDPVNTPSGLNVAHPKVQQALADAVTDLRRAGIPLNAPLRGWQYEKRGGERIPIHGGPGTVGVFNAINVSWSGGGSEPGYPNVPHGSSFVQVTSFNEGCPDDRTILTYSLSENPTSPYFADQTRLFSDKVWVDPPFCEDEVQASNPSKTLIQGCMPGGCGEGAGSDGDGDEVPNELDDCPLVAGPPANNGCPLPAENDRDGDGVLDGADGCPDEPGPEDNNGCPQLDAGTAPATGTAPSGPSSANGCGGAINGTGGDDVLTGTENGNRMFGFSGDDEITSLGGDDCVRGHEGADVIRGDGGDDKLHGGRGPDEITDGPGRDFASGGHGNDTIRSRDGDRDTVRCGRGNDTAVTDNRDQVRGCEDVS